MYLFSVNSGIKQKDVLYIFHRKIQGHSRPTGSCTVDAALGVTGGLHSKPKAHASSLGRNKPQTHGLNHMAGSHFCPLFLFGLDCLQKNILAFLLFKWTKCNLVELINETQEFPGSTTQFQTWKARDKILLLLVLSLRLFKDHIFGESLGSECSVVLRKIFASPLSPLFGYDTS